LAEKIFMPVLSGSIVIQCSVVTPGGKKIEPPEKGWRWSKELFEEKVTAGEIIFVDDETRIIRKIYLCNQKGRVPESIWFGEEVGTTREATNEISLLLPDAPVFATPKPERLIQRIIHISTNSGDYVLDSFLGSGTTAAVAHKMGRRYIGVEMGEQAKTHCAARLKKVIDGEQGGVSAAAGWKGGGGFRFFKLGEAVFDNERRIKPGIFFENLVGSHS
jgi:adenine-specific DNA-methyltransferase